MNPSEIEKPETPSPDDLRALSNVAFRAQLECMPQPLDEGINPVEQAQQLIAALLDCQENGKTYRWLQERLTIDKAIKHLPNSAFAELEITRAAAEAMADFLSAPDAAKAKTHIAGLRKTREALARVVSEVSLSDAARAELSSCLNSLRWLDAISAKSRLREQVLLYQIFEIMQVWTDEQVAATLTPLLVTLTGMDDETAAKTIRRSFVSFKRHFAAIREEVEFRAQG